MNPKKPHRERERARVSERARVTDIETERERARARETDIETEREIDRERERDRLTEIERELNVKKRTAVCSSVLGKAIVLQ